MLETIEEAVCATLALPIDPLEVPVALTDEPKNKYAKLLEQWMRRWSLGGIGTPEVGMLVEQILQGGDNREEFKRDFVLYVYY
mgnify:CR=1 FL=1